MDDIARVLIVFGIVMVLVGAGLLLVGRVPFIGRLPGDFTFSSGGFTCFFPLATSIVLSILLSVVLTILLRVFQNR